MSTLRISLGHALLYGATWLASAALAQPAAPAPAASVAPAAMTSGSPLTRMQRCQSEIVGMQGAERSRNLRECLINRAEGERLIARDCSRQYRSLPASPATDKTTFQKQCIATGLQASHKELPRRKAAEPAQYTNAPSAPTAEGSAEDKPPAP